MKSFLIGLSALLLLAVGPAFAFGPPPITAFGIQLDTGTKTAASTTVPLTTNGTTAAANPTLHFAATTGVVVGMAIVDSTAGTVIPAGTVVTAFTATTVTMSANATGAGVGATDSIVFSGATLNKAAGVITSEALTTAAAATYTLTLTNSTIAAADQVFVSLSNGTNSAGSPTIQSVTPAAGSVVVIVHNAHASVAFNGTLKIAFASFKN